MMNEWVLSSSVLIAAVLLGRFLLRGRISLRLQYALWAVVLVRLLLPVQLFTSDFGTGSVAQTVDIAEPVRQVYFSANENRYEREYDIAFRNVVAEYEAANRPADPIAIEKTAQTMAETRLEVDFKSILLHIWFAGMVVMTAVIISCNVHLALQLKRRRWALDIPESLLPVYVTEAVPTPCVFGFFRPAVYLTPEAAKEPQVRRHVLEHELTHYRHFDHVWSVLRSLCLVLHWYNPLVWIAAKVSRADAELACDEGSLARLGEDQRGDYGRTLIGLTCSAPISDLLITATTMTGSAGSIRERIKLLMKRPRNTILTVTAVILMVTLIVGCTFAGAPELPPETTTPPETTEPTENSPLYQTELAYAPPMEQALADYADKNPQELTEDELILVRDRLASVVYDPQLGDYTVAPVAAFFTSYYDHVSKLDLQEFLRYFPASGASTEEEFQLLHQKYGADFAFAQYATLEEMPVPVHRYKTADIDQVFQKYTALPFQALQNRDTVYYLEETDCYYNFTSDFAPGTFDCVNGFRYDGGAILYSDGSALFLTEAMGSYTISAHLPLLGRPGEAWDLNNADGALVYPGIQWFMTETEVLAALGLTHRDVLDAQHINDNGMNSSSVTINHSGAFGVPMVLDFTFRSYWEDAEPVLTEVYGHFIHPGDFETVRSLYAQALGDTDVQINPGLEERWDSDILLLDLVGREGYEILDRCAKAALNVPASYVQWLSNGTPEIIWFTELPEPGAPEWSGGQAAEVAALFGEDADPWYLAALNIQYQNWYYVDALTFFGSGQPAAALAEAEQAVITAAYGKEALNKSIFRMTSENMDQIVRTYLGVADLWCLNLSDFLFCPETDAYLAVLEEAPQLHRPEILSLEQLDSNQVRMIYRFPDESQRYCATLLKGRNWKVYSNQLLVSKPSNARYLTEEEIAQVNAAYAHDDVSGFFNCLFSDPAEVDLEEFLRYYTPSGEASQEEWDLLREKYGENLFFYEVEQLRDMPIPVHRYEIDHIDQVFRRYTGIGYEDIMQKDTLYHLDQTRCYYNGTSDANPGLFICRNGWVYDGYATLFSRDSALVLKEINGTYYIQAHMSALIAE